MTRPNDPRPDALRLWRAHEGDTCYALDAMLQFMAPTRLINHRMSIDFSIKRKQGTAPDGALDVTLMVQAFNWRKEGM